MKKLLLLFGLLIFILSYVCYLYKSETILNDSNLSYSSIDINRQTNQTKNTTEEYTPTLERNFQKKDATVKIMTEHNLSKDYLANNNTIIRQNNTTIALAKESNQSIEITESSTPLNESSQSQSQSIKITKNSNQLNETNQTIEITHIQKNKSETNSTIRNLKSNDTNRTGKKEFIDSNVYTFKVTKLKNQDVTLEGYIPNREFHKKVLKVAINLYGESHLTDNLKKRSNAPDGWEKSVMIGLNNLTATFYGDFKLENKNFNFNGYLETTREKNILLKSLKNNLSSDYNANYNIETSNSENIQAKYCQEQFKLYLSEDKIHFELDKTIIKQESYPFVDQLITVAMFCPENNLIIEGHSDADGSALYNKKLSKKRADAVKNYFIKHGIAKKRLKTIGYGEEFPIASNYTQAGKQKNRRIEIKVEEIK